MDAKLHKMVQVRANALWQEAGCPDGANLLHWMQAERELGIVGEADGSDPAERVDFERLLSLDADAAATDEALERTAKP